VTALRLAVMFLTRIPVGTIDQPSARQLTGAAGFFPLVGGLVAGIGLAAWLAADALLGPMAAAVACVVTTVVVTGAFHEDGLADSADGLWGGHTVQRRLEIMRDSRLGTYGTLALMSDLLLRIALLVPLGPLDVARVLIAGHVLGRGAALVVAGTLPPARADGLGPLIGRVTRPGAIIAGVTVAAAAVVTGGIWAPAILVVGALAVLAMRHVARARLGGYTGDLLGASVQVANLAVAVVIAALIHASLL
jgi:adenosylcobinamide-GDP ribazoletransferase